MPKENESKKQEDIPMEMEWMKPIIPIVHCQLNICTMGIRDRIRLMPIYSGIKRIVAHSQSGEEGWGFGFSVCPIYSSASCTTPWKERFRGGAKTLDEVGI
jgi:hypothetical protein